MKLDDLGPKDIKRSYKQQKAAFLQGSVHSDYTLFAEPILLH